MTCHNGSDFKADHIEQVAVDHKIHLVLSTPGEPQGRRRIEYFFRTVHEWLSSPAVHVRRVYAV
jgi:hypothetical protein